MDDQLKAAENGGLLLGFAFGFLTEAQDSTMFFFFFGTAMSLFKEYNIEIIYENKENII